MGFENCGGPSFLLNVATEFGRQVVPHRCHPSGEAVLDVPFDVETQFEERDSKQ